MLDQKAGEFTAPGPENPEVRLGVIAAPSLPAGLAQRVTDDLVAVLRDRDSDVHWRVSRVVDGLVRPPTDDGALVEASRDRLLAECWDLALVLTDLPLRVGRRPVVAHASPVHGVAVLSVPALGTVAVGKKATDAALRLVDALLGDNAAPDGDANGGVGHARARSRRRSRRLAELGTTTATTGFGVSFTARVLTGHLRLMAGMVRANQPWRLAARLSRALTAAAATGAFALVTSDIWRLADALGWLHLTVLAVGAATAITVTLVLGAGLWEKAQHPRVRQQVVLFNLATTATVLIGVLAFYAALFALALPATLLLVPTRLLSSTLGHQATIGDFLELAWLTSSLATIGGALGAGLETDDAVRQAAYSYRTSASTERDAHSLE